MSKKSIYFLTAFTACAAMACLYGRFQAINHARANCLSYIESLTVFAPITNTFHSSFLTRTESQNLDNLYIAFQEYIAAEHQELAVFDQLLEKRKATAQLRHHSRNYINITALGFSHPLTFPSSKLNADIAGLRGDEADLDEIIQEIKTRSGPIFNHPNYLSASNTTSRRLNHARIVADRCLMSLTFF